MATTLRRQRAGAIAREVMLADFVEGSDPGLCWAVSAQIAPPLVAYGQDAQRMVLNQERARTLARNLGIALSGLGGSEDGVIGALAGIGLASAGNDGRYILHGTVRDLAVPCTVANALAAGVDAVYTLDGRRVDEGVIEVPGKAPLPCPVGGRAVLFVEEVDGRYLPVRRN